MAGWDNPAREDPSLESCPLSTERPHADLGVQNPVRGASAQGRGEYKRSGVLLSATGCGNGPTYLRIAH